MNKAILHWIAQYAVQAKKYIDLGLFQFLSFFLVVVLELFNGQEVQAAFCAG